MTVFDKILAALLCTASSLAMASDDPSYSLVGKQLSSQEMAQLNQATKIRAAGRDYTLHSTVATAPAVKAAGATPAADFSYVVNGDGVLGRSDHSVRVSQVQAPDLSAALGQLKPAPVSVQDYAHMGLTVLRFASFADAASAREALAQRLPGARVDLPIRYTTPKTR